jgi:hypothetical protein
MAQAKQLRMLQVGCCACAYYLWAWRHADMYQVALLDTVGWPAKSPRM